MLPKISSVFRLAKEPELKFTPSGMQVCSLYLVASEKYKDKESTLWIGATAFSKTAEFIATVKKGQRIFCVGKIQTDEWMNSQGEKQSRITMIIDSFDYIEKRDDNQPAQTTNTAQTPQQAQQPTSQQNHSGQAPQTGGGFATSNNQPFEEDEEIPFN